MCGIVVVFAAAAVEAPDVGVAVDYEDKLQLEEMDVSSTEESELESDTEAVSRLAYIFIAFHFSFLRLSSVAEYTFFFYNQMGKMSCLISL